MTTFAARARRCRPVSGPRLARVRLARPRPPRADESTYVENKALVAGRRPPPLPVRRLAEADRTYEPRRGILCRWSGMLGAILAEAWCGRRLQPSKARGRRRRRAGWHRLRFEWHRSGRRQQHAPLPPASVRRWQGSLPPRTRRPTVRSVGRIDTSLLYYFIVPWQLALSVP